MTETASLFDRFMADPRPALLAIAASLIIVAASLVVMAARRARKVIVLDPPVCEAPDREPVRRMIRLEPEHLIVDLREHARDRLKSAGWVI
jgi:hypothetical protein